MPPTDLGRGTRRTLVPGNGPLSKVPPLAVFLLVLALFVAAVWLKGIVGAVLLGVIALGLIGLLVGTWRFLRPVDRVLRVVILAILVGAIVSMLR